MCQCTPEIKTPFCGKPGCEWPPQKETNALRAWVDAALAVSSPTDVVPLEAYVHGIGADVERDLVPLWKMTVAARPRVVLELGTRTAVSTRTLAHACQRVGAILFTCDPDPMCAHYLRGVPAVAFRTTGENLFALSLFPPGSVDVLFVDTDPHSFEQTMKHLDTWAGEGVLAMNGVAIFHDVNARSVDGSPRPDIQVKEAIESWVFREADAFLRERPGRVSDSVGWEYVELGHDGAGGLGVLRRRG